MDAEYYYNLGEEHLKRSDHEKAVSFFKTAIRLNPNVAQYYNALGLSLYVLTRFEESLIAFNNAIKFKPDFYPAHTGRGLVLQELERYNEALTTFDTVINLVSDYALAHHGRGDALLYLGRFEESLAAQDIAITLDPNYAPAHQGRGDALYGLKRYIESLNAQEMAIKLDSSLAPALHGRGNALFELERYQEALSAYHAAINLDTEYGKPYYGIGNVLLVNKQYQKALIAYKTAINIEPYSAPLYHGLGNALFELKRYQEALAAYNTAITLNEYFGPAYYSQAHTYNGLTNYSAAQANYTRYIFLGQVLPSHYSNLLTYFRDHGDAPFVVKRLLGEHLAYRYLDSYSSFLERIDSQCRPVQECIDWATMQGWPQLAPDRFLLFEALCRYYMGDTAEAYYIFNDILDPKDVLSLMGQYYYARSALHSALPTNSLAFVLDNAREAARDTANDPATTPFQRYYAGLLLYHFGENAADATLAGECFDQAKGLLAAKYMRWLLAAPHDRFALRQEILAQETRLPPEKSFIHGLLARNIGRDFANYDEAMQHYCFYHELAEAIQGVHYADVPQRIVSFYEYWQFVLSDKREKQSDGQEIPSEQDELIEFRNGREAEKAYSQVGKLLDAIRVSLSTGQIEENIRGRLGSLFEKLIFLKEQAARDALTQRPGGIEDLLASHIWESAEYKTFENLNIRGLQFWEVHQQFVLYFLGRGQISLKAAINLIMYAGYAAAQDNLFTRVKQAAALDGTSDLLKASPNLDQVQKLLKDIKESEKMHEVGKALAGAIGVTILPLGSTLGSAFLLGFMVKSLLAIIEERFLKPKEQLPYSEDYALFLQSLNARVAAARREGTMDPLVEKILGLA